MLSPRWVEFAAARKEKKLARQADPALCEAKRRVQQARETLRQAAPPAGADVPPQGQQDGWQDWEPW